ncbi:bacterioferritin BFRB [Mycobacterium tuberculosis]|nr:bacterioferritin BFRB [Mycobacterium tuberculosis]
MTEYEGPKTKFHALMQEQIHNEFTAAQQYVAIAVYFDSEDLPQLAKHFYSQAVEERNHAMMLVQHLLDRDLRVEIPGVDTVRNQFDRPREALALALDQERTVTDQVGRLTAVARDEGDFLGEQFMQWFLQEQIEEVALMATLVRVADRAGANLFELENFVAREVDVAPAASGAPHAAGGPPLDPWRGSASGPVRPPVFQPGLGAAGVVSTNPGHPDLPAKVDVLVLIDVPAVHRPALSCRAVNELRIFL